ncbi:MAG: response regulator [Desulfobacterales bacterium]|nr:response regulator [Desulfobacterales bacterium]
MSEQLNILVVDDDEMILRVFKDIFHAVGSYSILTARDGAEALKVFRHKKVDFCFTDINMPGMDGIEFTKKIHEIDNTVPVVVMTGYPSTDNAIATLKHGVVDFLVKPFNIGTVKLTIKRALEQKALFIENMLLKEEIKKKERIARLNKELSNKVSDLKILNMILQKVNWVTNSADLFDLIVRLSADITTSDEVHFYLLDDTLARPALIASFCKEHESSCSSGLSAHACPGTADVCHTQAGTGRQDGLVCSAPARGGNSVIVEVLAKKMSEGIPLLVDGASDTALWGANISSVIAIPFKIREKLFGMLAAIGRDSSVRLAEKDLYYLNFLAERATFVIENVALYENIYQNLFSTLYAFVEAIEAKDPYTKQHSGRVTKIALSMGKEIGCPDDQLDLLSFSGHLHDIGKIGIPDSILLKPGPLTGQEYEAIKKHPVIGANIVGHLGLLIEEQKIILHHHERWDGKGYPGGLKGESIPFLSRIVAVADVYDAMASDRAYRERFPDEVVIDTIRKNAGTQFDKEVVEGFLKVYERGEIGSKEDEVISNARQDGSKVESELPKNWRAPVDQSLP